MSKIRIFGCKCFLASRRFFGFIISTERNRTRRRFLNRAKSARSCQNRKSEYSVSPYKARTVRPPLDVSFALSANFSRSYGCRAPRHVFVEDPFQILRPDWFGEV